MTIRTATDADIPEIVELLKLSLGQSKMPKSEAFWHWKHVRNPFGPSHVLLAYEDKQLIGVRAFMNWEWRQLDKIVKAVRAVDTATHPAFQGKGVFSTLTRRLVDQCRSMGVEFIYNTPNEKSAPGYLKLGWRKVGRLPVDVRFRLPVSQARLNQLAALTVESLNNISIQAPTSDALKTNYSLAYLNWRYIQNPNQNYHYVHDSASGLFFIFRLKKFKFGTELRICDVLPSSEFDQPMHHSLKEVAGWANASLITSAGTATAKGFVQISIGPLVTQNILSDKVNAINFQTWKPSLGDLEFF